MADNYDIHAHNAAGAGGRYLTKRSIEVAPGIYADAYVLIGADGLTPASASNPLPVGSGTRAEFDLVLSLDTNIYAADDVLFDTQEVLSFFAAVGGFAVLEKLQVYDEDDQGQPFDIYFLNANTSLGTENSAPNISDANARTIIGHLSIVADNYKDTGAGKRANLIDIDLPLKSAASTSLWVGGITKGTPTHAAAGMRLRFTVRY